VRAWRRRLAQAGGAMGVRLMTFDGLYGECLNAAGEVYASLSDPVQHRLIHAVVQELDLVHYAPLVERPGFVQMLRQLLGELKAVRVWPEDFAQAVATLGDEPRLRELALIYAAYQERLQAHEWADRAGLGWLAVEALEERASGVGADWPLLVVDGFDNFTPVQLALLNVLAARVGELIATLSGSSDGEQRPFVHRRFDQTRQLLEDTLGVVASPLPERAFFPVPALAHLEASLFRPAAGQVDGSGVVEMVEAPDRAGEVRAALRWLKARLVEDGMRTDEVALLARSIPPYRPFILETAGEFGLPVRLVDGLPLRTNPAVAALLDLLRLLLPRSEDDPEPALPRRGVVEAWRSPYFDWSARPAADAPEAIGIQPGDADDLDIVARWSRVIGGLGQWEEAFDALLTRPEALSAYDVAASGKDEEQGLPAGMPVGTSAQVLRSRFLRFVQRLTPPQGARPVRDFVGWLEALIGPDPRLHSPRYPLPEEPTALQVVARARDAATPVAERDVAALQALKDVLRGLVWAEQALGLPAVDFPRFLGDLQGAIEAAAYRLPLRPGGEEILVADVVQARGVPFRAVAVLGLAEGEFPATLTEDAFLRDDDRARLRSTCGLNLELSTESAEAEFFYETVTRPRERLLLTRPRLADNGAPWQPSPYWEEVRRLVRVEPVHLSSESVPPPDRVASWPELMESLAVHRGSYEMREWVARQDPDRQAALETAARLFSVRRQRVQTTPFDGDLSGWAEAFAARFGPQHIWSGSRLESYRACPFGFFVAHVLRLEPRREPAEGLDSRQLGSIYHRILKELYAAVADPGDPEQLLAALPDVARSVLDRAPAQEGFRVTAWWQHTRAEIVENVRRSLQALAGLEGDFLPYRFEVPFGLQAVPPLVIAAGEDRLRLRGVIDRVDRDSGGRLRIIDYKTGSPSAFGSRAIAEGKKLQLPLYALAARDALGMGEPSEGFYWHVRHAEPSTFRLSRFGGGPEAGMELAVQKAWEAVHGARQGRFVPCAPDDGCPSYCPATPFCWHYRLRYEG
ncbi:MAG: PD-(D/E)XK nuclease family protein, partial [Chloroflexi bacterium]|nr:PD-(D/E)XK nuclease family protein [Chloroflexota bacterium]